MIVILGGGFGGLSTARELRRLTDEEIIVIDKKEKFSVGMANLWLMIGEREKPKEKELRRLEDKGIKFLNEEVISIDVKRKIIKTKNRELGADYIVIALGAEMDLDAIEGFRSNALNLYDSIDAMKIYERLKNMKEGKVAVLITSTPFKCPPAPYEAVLLLDSYFRKRGIRDNIEIALYTPEPHPVPVAGRDVSNIIKNMLEDRKIVYNPNSTVEKIEDRKIIFNDRNAEYDLLIGIPVHKAPKILEDTGLLSSGWIKVNPKSLETEYEGIYAIGDVTIVNNNGITLPKAGTFAEREGIVVANNIKSNYKEYDGYGYCYIDVGDGKAALAEGHFYDKPPRVELKEASEYYKQQMIEFERERLDML
ncbi:MAG: NAD(P)/FAD-dependent oxidoreductase [Candidatus Nitrosothermus koennekii]|nr:MAG: NAD(P)/FAD-dependent oxidoreductase [Candidatus Nitrosothermus koennekii]